MGEVSRRLCVKLVRAVWQGRDVHCVPPVLCAAWGCGGDVLW
jgi:hypothetical protein